MECLPTEQSIVATCVAHARPLTGVSLNRRQRNTKGHMTDFSISYSFGGTKDAPLISRTIPMTVEGELNAARVQEALLERTDMVLADLCAVFDAAEAALVASHFADATQVDILMGAAFFCVNNILAQCPSSKYAHMYGRVQALLNYRPELLKTLGPRAVAVLSEFMLPVLERLMDIEAVYYQERTGHAVQ